MVKETAKSLMAEKCYKSPPVRAKVFNAGIGLPKSRNGNQFALIMAISALNTVRLVRIERDGSLCDHRNVAESIRKVCRTGADYFRKVGYRMPWVGYVAFDGNNCVGACGFKGAPDNQTVEISYGTFAPHRGQGYATAMVQCLIELAKETDPEVTIKAQTEPQRGASSRVLTKTGFIHIGETIHPQDGLVWEWRLL